MIIKIEDSLGQVSQKTKLIDSIYISGELGTLGYPSHKIFITTYILQVCSLLMMPLLFEIYRALY
jgi:hypothetical protein